MSTRREETAMGGPLNADPDKQDENPQQGPPSEQDGPSVNEGPPINPPSHGDPTNPAQPRS
jgi:hypothetical protein